MNPLISIILPIYNVKTYIPKCMDSIFAQTYENLEIIMIDDGSTDGGGRLCDDYAAKDTRIKVYHKENGGISDARNYGISKVSGEYMSFIDPDDYVDKDYIEYLYSLIRKYDTKMSICQHRVHYDDGSLKEYGDRGDEELVTEKCLERLLYHDVIDTAAWGKLYHKSILQNVRYPKGKLYEDTAVTYAFMVECDGIAVGYESKYNYIFHDVSISNSTFKESKFDLIDVTDKMTNAIEETYPSLKEAAIRRRVYARFATLNFMLDVKGYKEKKKEYIDYIKKYKKQVKNNPKTPKRDKLAITLLSMGYPIYRVCWKSYRNKIMRRKK